MNVKAIQNQVLVNDMKSKINEWYVDDGNLADLYKIVLKDLKRDMRSENDLASGLNFAKGELCFQEILLLRSITQFCTNFKKCVWV